MLFWVFDINMTNGPELLTKATLGKFVAIASKEDAPLYNKDGQTYVTFLNLSIFVYTLWIGAAILMLVPVADIWDIAKGLVSTISDVVKGLMFNTIK